MKVEFMTTLVPYYRLLREKRWEFLEFLETVGRRKFSEQEAFRMRRKIL